MLRGLQQRSGEGGADWQQLEPALSRLGELLAPPSDPIAMPTSKDQWWLEIGPVDLSQKLATIQRGSFLIAAISQRDDGRLRIAAYRPLDSKSAEYLTGLAQIPDAENRVCMRESNWEYALDCSATIGNAYASERGEAYLSYWEKGIGISWDDSEVPEWRQQKKLKARNPAIVATELEVHCTLSAEGDAEVVLSPQPVERQEHQVPAWKGKRQQRRTVQGRFLGCLLGGAVGDALGAPVEFMKRTEILLRFGANGIRDFAPAYGGIGKITDDTQMTLFTAEGLIRGWVRGCFKGITTYPGVVANAYLRWLMTQGERPICDMDFGSDETGWLFQQQELHSRRAPGNTCLAALRAMKSLGEPARNNSKGCGGVMRVAPVGLFAWRMNDHNSPPETFRIGAELAALTHGHPTGSLPAGFFAVMIQALTDGATLADALAASKACLRSQPGHEETRRATELAEELAATDTPRDAAIERLGQGWVAEEALAISIYCALVARDFEDGVALAVNHDGDSDSTGAMVGNLLGAKLGVQAIPERWLQDLELRSVITELADDLYACKEWKIGEYSDNEALNAKVWTKYPGF